MNAASNNTVSLHWVPAHSNVKGNELADSQAKRASSKRLLGPEPAIGLPPEESRAAMRKWADQQHQLYWENSAGFRQSKEVRPKVDEPFASTFMSLSRTEMRNITQIVTGIGNLARHRHNCKKVASPTCTYCSLSEEETPWHHVAICPGFKTVRKLRLDR